MLNPHRKGETTKLEALNHHQQKIIEIKDKFGDIGIRCLLTKDKYLTTSLQIPLGIDKSDSKKSTFWDVF